MRCTNEVQRRYNKAVIYLITGTNEYRVRQEIAALTKRLGVRAETIDADRLNLNSLADIVRGTSLFHETRLVVLRQLSEHKELWAKLGDWARDVSADTALVLVETKPDKRTKAYKTLACAGEVIVAEPLTERTRSAAETWLRDVARAQGVEISRVRATNMVSRALVPNETSRIAEVDQLQLAHAVRALANVDAVTDEVIATVLPPAREFSVFDILELAARRDVRAVQKALDELRAADDPYKVMALLWVQWAQFAAVMTAEGVSSTRIASDLAIHPFVVKKLQALMPYFTMASVRELTQLAAELDYQSQTLALAPWDIIDRFVLGVSTRNSPGEK